jgi:sulfur relay (sulfurtransferase) complex TusBCD TusD component (DsrE family)
MLTNLFSPTHSLDTRKLSDYSTQLTFAKDGNYQWNKDFSLFFRSDEIVKPQVVLSESVQNPNTYAAMLSFIPDFNLEPLNDCQKAAMQSNDQFDADMDAARGEFIFVIDRSGSMSGGRMSLAREAVIFLLKSLPPQCYYNIISFGNSYEYMFPNSQLVEDDETMDKTIAKIKTFTANMGGTELDQPLNFSYTLKKQDHSPKLVFLLTDGDVGNPKKTAALAKKFSQTCRTFVLGVGSGASEYLCREIAAQGRGRHEMVKENSQIMEKMMFLLSASLSPVYDDFQFNFDDNVVEMMTPGHNSPLTLLKNE